MARAALLALAVGTVACGSSSSGPPAPSPSANPSSRSGFTYRGLDHVSWWHDEYTYGAAQAARDQLAATKANWAGWPGGGTMLKMGAV